MAKQSVQKLLDLTASEIEKLSASELKHYVQILNSAANKRLTRMEKAGVFYASKSYVSLLQEEGKAKRFSSIVKREKSETAEDYENRLKTELKTRYGDVRRFLNPNLKSNTLQGIRETINRTKDVYEALKMNPKNVYSKTRIDRKGVKRKKGSLKKSVIREFWKEYHKFQQARQSAGHGGGTNMDDVSTFYDEYYSKGKTSLIAYQSGATKEYEQRQRKRMAESAEQLDQQTAEYENPPWQGNSVSAGNSQSQRTGRIEPKKSKGSGKNASKEEKLNYHKIRFKKVKIF